MQYNQTYSWRVGLDSLGQQLIKERGTPIIKPWVGEASQPWLATYLGDGN